MTVWLGVTMVAMFFAILAGLVAVNLKYNKTFRIEHSFRLSRIACDSIMQAHCDGRSVPG